MGAQLQLIAFISVNNATAVGVIDGVYCRLIGTRLVPAIISLPATSQAELADGLGSSPAQC